MNSASLFVGPTVPFVLDWHSEFVFGQAFELQKTSKIQILYVPEGVVIAFCYTFDTHSHTHTHTPPSYIYQ